MSDNKKTHAVDFFARDQLLACKLRKDFREALLRVEGSLERFSRELQSNQRCCNRFHIAALITHDQFAYPAWLEALKLDDNGRIDSRVIMSDCIEPGTQLSIDSSSAIDCSFMSLWTLQEAHVWNALSRELERLDDWTARSIRERFWHPSLNNRSGQCNEGELSLVRDIVNWKENIESEIAKRSIADLINIRFPAWSGSVYPWDVSWQNVIVAFGSLELIAKLRAKDLFRYAPEPPLVTAAAYNRLDVIQLFAENGDDLEQQNAVMYTPLSVAAQYGHVEICDYLVNAGANVKAEDLHGSQPLYFCESPTIARLLIDAGANPNHYNRRSPPTSPIKNAIEEVRRGMLTMYCELGFLSETELLHVLKRLTPRERGELLTQSLRDGKQAPQNANHIVPCLPFYRVCLRSKRIESLSTA